MASVTLMLTKDETIVLLLGHQSHQRRISEMNEAIRPAETSAGSVGVAYFAVLSASVTRSNQPRAMVVASPSRNGQRSLCGCFASSLGNFP